MPRRSTRPNDRLPNLDGFSKMKTRYACQRMGIDPVKADKDDLVRKCPKMTREQFELRLVNIETSFQLAYEAAKSLDYLKCDARDLSRQRRMNMMIESQICMLQDETNVTIATTRCETVGHTPFPLRVDHAHTMLNYDNQR